MHVVKLSSITEDTQDIDHTFCGLHTHHIVDEIVKVPGSLALQCIGYRYIGED